MKKAACSGSVELWVNWNSVINYKYIVFVGLSGGALYDDEQLSRPIKHFVAEYVRKHVSIPFPVITSKQITLLYPA